jgi:hypothetical protein
MAETVWLGRSGAPAAPRDAYLKLLAISDLVRWAS